MKKILGLCVIIIFLTGCKHTQVAVEPAVVDTPTSFVQLFEIQGVNIDKRNDYYVYENDSIKVIYDFWENKGEMHFSVYNKLNKPLYIDWFKSSFIWNSVSAGYSNGKQADAKSFIPPKSYISVKGESLAKWHFRDWGTDFTKTTEPRHDNNKMSTAISSKQFTKENSPLNFRNYMTFSFAGDFSTEFSIDNEYFVKKISVMDARHFWNTQKEGENSTRFQKASDFFYVVN